MNIEHATMPVDAHLLDVPSAPNPLITDRLSRGEFAPADELMQSLEQHRPTLITYCTLALQPSLGDADEDRMAAILTQAMDDPLLSFWLDEADCWVGEHLQALSADALKQQQSKLKRIIGQTWVDALWHDLQNRTKALQAYLKRAGVYSGAIDGIMGPTTQHAIESLKTAYPDELPLGYL
jgi:hypothetical protein